MQNVKPFKIGLLVLTLAFCMHSSGATAQDGCFVPTVPKNVEGIENWVSKPNIYSSSETIAPDGSINLRVDTGGHGCPAYTWSVSGKGYSLLGTTTYSDTEIVTLSCGPGT